MSLMQFLLFAFVASITLGSTNILILTNSQRHNIKNTSPAVVGACVAASVIVLILGAGAREVLRQYPLVRQVMCLGRHARLGQRAVFAAQREA
ncbi:hypothetical protein QM999_13805 [Pectobacterium cacticida]